MAENEKLLYCVCFNRWDRRKRQWVPGTEYMHAENPGHARGQFRMANPSPRTHKIIAVAPVVGMFSDDESGEELYAEEGTK
jgi:hypothetical protein